MKKLLLTLFFLIAATLHAEDSFVARINMQMMILPGTAEYLRASIVQAEKDGAKALVITIDTPGGMLPTTQEMVQQIFKSKIPVIVYVTPSGATATSAGVFITLAGHVAAMAPGTTIGAAHPVAGDGKNIEGDMRAKAENMTVAMVRSISDERGRNSDWAEKAVKESSSLTENEALKQKAIDFVAEDLSSLLKQIKGKKIIVNHEEIVLPDFSNLRVVDYEISFKQSTINFLANPNIVALLWLVATTGITIELYNPGLIFPGVAGVICLILALAVSQIIPITQSGVILIVIGTIMIASEIFITSGILAVGGIVALFFGSIYLIDTIEAPGMQVSLTFITPFIILMSAVMLGLSYALISAARRKNLTGADELVGKEAKALSNFAGKGKVFVNGEIWKAELNDGFAEKNEKLEVKALKDGLILEVIKRK